MRPRARIALAIGAVILAGLVAFALMPRKKPQVAENPQDNLPTPGSTSLPTSIPTTEPEATDPFAGSPTTALTPTTATIPPAPLSTGTGDRWDDAFHSGRLGGVTPAPGDGARGTTPRTYTVAAGDSFYTISQKVFGNTRQVTAIQKANPGVNPSRLRVGQILKMPEAVPAPVAPSTPTAHGVAPAPTDSGSSLAAGRTYKVQPGDNLNKISVKFYGNTKMAQKIFELNKSVIGSSPSSLRAGVTLRLPEGAATTNR